MSDLMDRPGGGAARPGAYRWLLALLASVVAAGCDQSFEPFMENTRGPYSVVGYLDLGADTQWVRVMPIRQTLLTDPAPIDAVVTLERLGGGRTVTLRDSLFKFTDAQLGGVAYAHVFWTTERLEPRARYRLRAVRSDGAASTALVTMPADLEFTFLNFQKDTAWVEARAERVLFVETLHAMRSVGGEPGGSAPRRQRPALASGTPGLHVLFVDGTAMIQPGVVDVGRTEMRVVAVGSDWLYPAKLSDLDVALPGPKTSNVENGLGFVGGVATRVVPFHRCVELATRPGGMQPCTVNYTRSSAYVSGRVVRQPCGRPHALANIRLTERFAGGGAALRIWKTGWDGGYRFDGIEPGSELVLDLGPGTPAVRLPRLAAGERHVVPDIAVTSGCAP